MKERQPVPSKQLSLDLGQPEDRPVAAVCGPSQPNSVVMFPLRAPTAGFQDRVIEKLMRTRVVVTK